MTRQRISLQRKNKASDKQVFGLLSGPYPITYNNNSNDGDDDDELKSLKVEITKIRTGNATDN